MISKLVDIMMFITDSNNYLLLSILSGLIAFYFSYLFSFSSILGVVLLSRKFPERWLTISILIGCLLIGIYVGYSSYIGLGNFNLWYNTPMGPPLQLTPHPPIL